MVDGQFLGPVEVAFGFHLVEDDPIFFLDGDRAQFVFGIVHIEEGAECLGGIAILPADAAGMDHVVAFAVVFDIADICGEELLTALLAILPYLLDLHLAGVEAR
jgi:hypothetical protein